jgi:hypothetical protein
MMDRWPSIVVSDESRLRMYCNENSTESTSSCGGSWDIKTFDTCLRTLNSLFVNFLMDLISLFRTTFAVNEFKLCWQQSAFVGGHYNATTSKKYIDIFCRQLKTHKIHFKKEKKTSRSISFQRSCLFFVDVCRIQLHISNFIDIRSWVVLTKMSTLFWKKIISGSTGIWTRDLSHPKRESYP